MPTGHSPHPLRILELSQGLAGAVCGRLLAGLGHDVVKCEPAQGDYLRWLDATECESTGPTFLEVNAGKRGLVHGPGLDEDGILRLAGRADVVIVDGDPVSPRLSATALREGFPRLVVVAVSTFGLDDARLDPGCDSLLAEAYGGLATMIGEPDRSPLALGGEQAAYMAGVLALLGVMLAVRRRSLAGSGDIVDVSLADAVAYLDWKSDVLCRAGSAMPRRTGASAGRWRLIRASDGWVGVIFQGKEWPALVELVGDTRLRDPSLADEAYRGAHPEAWWPAVREWAARLPKAEIYRRAQALRLPFGQLVPVSEVDGVEQFRSRGFIGGQACPATAVGSPMGPGLAWHTGAAPGLGEHQGSAQELWTGPWEEALRSPAGAGAHAPLAGVRVIDLGTITAGAGVGRILADYGAEVIKVESPNRPDSFRRWIVDAESPTAGAGERGIAPLFDSNNAGKRAVAVDLKSADGLSDFKRLVADADVLIENFAVGVTKRLGISFDDLRVLNPRLVYLSLSSQGQYGPESAARSYGSTLDLLSGLASITGYDSDHPMWSSVAVNYPDQLAAVFGATAVTACLADGVAGVHLDISQREVVSWTIAGQIRKSHTAPDQAPAGNRRPGRSPHDIYPCAGPDEWIAISCRTDEHRRRLAAAISVTVADTADLGTWSASADHIDAQIASWTASRPAPECVRLLGSAGVPCALVSASEVRANDPHFTRRRVYLDADGRRLKGFPLVLGGYQPPVPPLAPGVGEHNAQLLAPQAPASPESAGRSDHRLAVQNVREE